MIDLGTIKQGERGTLAITWEFPDSLTAPASIVGATITAVAQNMDTGDVTAVSGTLTATAAAAATWALSEGDSGTAGTYLVTFRADVSGTPTYTLNGVLVIEENPAATAVQNGALVGLSSAEAAWVTAGKTAVADGADLVDANDLGTAAYAATGDFDAAGSAAAAQAAAYAQALAYDLTYPESLGTAVTKPAGFAFKPPFSIIKSGSTFYPVRDARLFDVRRYFVEGDGIYYVDVNTGNDSNAGTPQAPLKSILAAQAKADVTTIYVAPGHYDRVTGGTNTGEQTRSTNIVKNGEGTVYISRRQSGLSWVQDGTYTNCYTATRSLTFTVLDASQTDADGDILEYTKAASETACNSTAGSWYIDGSNKVYVHTTGGGAPTSDIWVLVEENILRYAGNITLYMEGITIVGGSGSAGGVWHKNSASGQFGKLFAKDCNFIYGNGNGVYTQGLALQIFQNCQARKNNADGFNYQTLNSTVPIAIELSCTGFKNGIDDALDNDNGSSIHGGGSVVRLNGNYQYNWGPNVVDIETAESWNLGCVASNSQSTTNGIGFYIDGEMWLDSCTAQGNDTDLYAAASGDILSHRNTTYGTSGGSGTVLSY